MLERRHAVLVGDRRGCSCRKQKAHDLLMRGAAVAEEHGLEESGPAEIVDVVNVYRGSLRESANHFDVSSVRRRNERRPAKPIRLRHVRSSAKDLVEHRHVSRLSEREEGIRTDVVLEVDLCARVHEDAHRLGAVGVDGRSHGGSATCIALVHIGTPVEQLTNGRGVAPSGRLNERARRDRVGLVGAARNHDERKQSEHTHIIAKSQALL